MNTSDYIIIGVVGFVAVLIITIILWRIWMRRRRRRQEEERIANIEISSPLPESVEQMKAQVEQNKLNWRGRENIDSNTTKYEKPKVPNYRK